MINEIIFHLEHQPVMILSSEKFETLLNEVETILEKDTYFRGKIRILNGEKTILVQELSNKDEIILRKVKSLAEGQEFIQDRLRIYENMWNGCGCKINYYK